MTEQQQNDHEHALQAQLLQAQKMESFGMLVGGIAHDFNNLLSGVIGFSELALSSLPSEHKSVPYIESIRQAGEKASDLTRRLLAFSRRQAMEPAPVNINSLLDGMASMLSRLIGEHIEIVLQTGEPVKTVIADQSQLEQVVMNLMVNARDAMPEGGTITVSARDVTLDEEFGRREGGSGGPHVRIRVTDTGSGISPELQEKIFKPFFTTKGEEQGTGLGLSTVSSIIERHRGFIKLTSQPGKGSTFDIYLPSDPSARPGNRATVRPETDLRGSETILVVEDDTTVRHLLVETLRGGGYSLLSAASAEEAAQLLKERREPLDLLLTDIVMTGMSGIKLAALVKEQRPETRVILMSGYTDNVLEQHGVRQDDPLFIQKPLGAQELLTRVRKVLDA